MSEPLVLHVGVGDCVRVTLSNRTDAPVSFHADLPSDGNQATASALKTQARKFRESLSSGDRAAAEAALLAACRAYDKAAAQGVIHKNNAANHKSQLRKQFNGSAA